MSSLDSRLSELRAAFKAKKLKACQTILENAKLDLVQIAFLPQDQLAQKQKELLCAREMLELGAETSVLLEDEAGFEMYMAQLKTYYIDYAQLLPESPFHYKMLGLDLLRLLVQNRLAAFHIALEQLPLGVRTGNAYVRIPVRLEQLIMVGSYNKAILMTDNAPADTYAFYLRKLVHTIREQIAVCMERAYTHLDANKCARMLRIDAKKLDEFARQRGWSKRDGCFHFDDANDNKEDKEAVVPSDELAKMAITYAREMEQIV